MVRRVRKGGCGGWGMTKKKAEGEEELRRRKGTEGKLRKCGEEGRSSGGSRG